MVNLTLVAAAMSHMRVPASVDEQTAIVPLVNPVVPPAADLLGGATAIPGWGSVLPHLVKKALKLLPESWSLEPVKGSCCNQRGLVTSFPYWVECYTSLVVILTAHAVPREDASIHGLLEDDHESK